MTQPYTIHERRECVTLGVNTVTYDVEEQKTGVTETYVVTELVERFGKKIVDFIKLYDDTHNVPFIPGEILEEGKYKGTYVIVPRGYPSEFARYCTKAFLGDFAYLIVDYNSKKVRADLEKCQARLRKYKEGGLATNEASSGHDQVIIKQQKHEIAHLRSLIQFMQHEQQNNGGAPIGPGLSAFRNYTGQACFLNCALQVLMHCGPLRNVASQLGKLDPISIPFCSLLEGMWSGDYPVLVARRIYGCIMDEYPTHDRSVKRRTKPRTLHHDPHSVLVTLLDRLHLGCNSVINPVQPTENHNLYHPDNSDLCEQAWADVLSRDNGPIVETFWGLEASLLTCNKCGDAQIRVQPFNTLCVEMIANGTDKCESRLSLAKCLGYMCAEEMIDGWTGCVCFNLNGAVSATKRLTLLKLPTVLVIQLKRFRTNSKGGGVKLDNTVTFPLRGLNLDHFMTRPQHCHSDYDLEAVIRHSGTANGGHCITQALVDDALVDDAKWYEFDDENVNLIEKPECNARGRFHPYVLVYHRRLSNDIQERHYEEEQEEQDEQEGEEEQEEQEGEEDFVDQNVEMVESSVKESGKEVKHLPNPRDLNTKVLSLKLHPAVAMPVNIQLTELGGQSLLKKPKLKK